MVLGLSTTKQTGTQREMHYKLSDTLWRKINNQNESNHYQPILEWTCFSVSMVD